ncbi:MAG: hypothetical protein JRN08_03385 [Nitrososphaerota archaeon]|nr:hypothetical protein [Nitrososphaerota archaeon]
MVGQRSIVRARRRRYARNEIRRDDGGEDEEKSERNENEQKRGSPSHVSEALHPIFTSTIGNTALSLNPGPFGRSLPPREPTHGGHFT